MSKNLKITLSSLVLVVVVGAGYFLALYNKPDTPEKSATSSAESLIGSSEDAGVENNGAGPSVLANILATDPEKATTLISFSADDLGIYEAEVKGKMTALSLLQETTDKLGLALGVKDYGEMGFMVEKIGEKENGDENKYWIYYLNGVSATTSASKLEVRKGDKVEWRFQESNF